MCFVMTVYHVLYITLITFGLDQFDISIHTTYQSPNKEYFQIQITGICSADVSL